MKDSDSITMVIRKYCYVPTKLKFLFRMRSRINDFVHPLFVQRYAKYFEKKYMANAR